MRTAVKLFLGSLLLAALAGCGAGSPDQPGVTLSFSKQFQSLDSMKSIVIRVAKKTLSDGKAFSCQAFLDRTIAHGDKRIQEAAKQHVDVIATPYEVVILNLPPGEYRFLATAWPSARTEVPQGDPIGFGCDEGSVVAGKKLQTSIFVVPYTK